MVPLRASTTKSESLPDDPTAFVPSRPWNLPSIATWDDSRNQNHPTDSAEEAFILTAMAMWPSRCSTPVLAPVSGQRTGCRALGWSARSIPFGTRLLRTKHIGLRHGLECRWRRMTRTRRILSLAWFATLGSTRCWLDRCRVPVSSTSERRFTTPTCPVRRCGRHSVYRRSERHRRQRRGRVVYRAVASKDPGGVQ